MHVPTQRGDNQGVYSRLSVPGAAVTDHQRWVSVDALRALAALMVLASHAVLLGPSQTEGVARLFPRLGVGVWIFFAASGYLIAGPFLRALLDGRPAPTARWYALRRAVRILPAYWVAFAAMLTLGGAALTDWWQLPVHALLGHGLVPGELKSLYLVAWSLGVEAIFYVLVPLVAAIVWRVARRRPIPLNRLVGVILGLWAATFAVSLGLALAFPFEDGRPLPGAVEVLSLSGSVANFFPGMLVFLAVLAVERRPSRVTRVYTAIASRPLPTLAVAVALFLVATQLPFQTSHVAAALQGPLLGVASGLVLSAFVHGRISLRFSRVLAPVGLISYGVYLWHWVILSAVWHYDLPLLTGGGTGPAITALRVVALVALTLPVALLSWLALERPLLRRTAGWERKRRAGRTAPARREDVPVPVAAGS
jgi:peptidoglycan/LPS O-acetylase OafA/YrhL